MNIISKEQMYEIDNKAQKNFLLPLNVIMEQAGYQIALSVCEYLNNDTTKKITIVAGKGNNAGDALVAARYLFDQGFNIRLFMLNSTKELSPLTLDNFNILKAMGIEAVSLEQTHTWDRFTISLRLSDVILDAILGIGFEDVLAENYEKAINLINQIPTPKIAIDVPSGTCADTGKVPSVAIQASLTLTLCLPKIGLFLAPASKHVGDLKVLPLNIPKQLLANYNKQVLISEDLITPLLPKRVNYVHKYQVGKVSVLAGNTGTCGAAILASRACMRSGSGLVDLFTFKEAYPIVAAALTEVLVNPVEETEAAVALAKFIASASTSKAALIGPGLGNTAHSREFLVHILSTLKIPLVLDADALNVISKHLDLLEHYPADVVITPHSGEFSRLIGVSSFEIEANKLAYASKYAQQWKITIVLKGNVTVVATPDGRTFVNNASIPAMATAGMGDVLAGMIAAFIAQGLDMTAAAITGVYLHMQAACMLRDHDNINIGMLASDVADKIPVVLTTLKNK